MSLRDEQRRYKVKRFEDKVAIVNGGTSGIGLAIVHGLVAEGAKVVVAARRQEPLDNLKEELSESIEIISADVTKEEDHIKVVELAQKKFGKLDVAFNVAGGSKFGTIDSIETEDWLWTIDLNLKGTFLGMKHQINAMKKNGGGSIVNVSSLNSEVPMWGGSAYAAAKAAVSMLTRNASIENTKDNIRFNALLPGLVSTPLTEELTSVEALNQAFMDRIPMKRAAEPEELAKVALFLASDDAAYVTGATLIADGGWQNTGYPDLSIFLGGEEQKES